MKKEQTAGIIIIGNEILSGKVRDINSHYLASELRDLGVDLKRISVIPDEIETIGEEVVEFSKKFDYVFTSGGVGPTHDDVTMEGIARGFGVRLVEHAEMVRFLMSRYDTQFNDAVIKMAFLPEGSIIDFNEHTRFPVISYKNIYIFPGIPEYIRNKFSVIKENFRNSAFYLKKIYVSCGETMIAEGLGKLVKKHENVIFGSYPSISKDDYSVLITIESKSPGYLKTALDELLRLIPKEAVLRHD